MIQLAALFLLALTFPIWIGALSAVLALGLHLMFHAPIVLGLIAFAVFVLPHFL